MAAAGSYAGNSASPRTRANHTSRRKGRRRQVSGSIWQTIRLIWHLTPMPANKALSTWAFDAMAGAYGNFAYASACFL
jgi:hypothetical protein